MFGRGGEEAAALLAAGVPFEVVPGISSALAAPMAAGVPLTMRSRASSFTVLTGHDDPESPQGVDWEAHARTGATLVVLMGAGRIGAIAKRLLVGGLDADTPVVAVHWACTEREQVLRTTLSEIGHAEVAAPCTFVIGDVAGLDLRSLPSPVRAVSGRPEPQRERRFRPRPAPSPAPSPARSPPPGPSRSFPAPVPTAAMPRRSQLRSDSTPRR